MAFYTFGRLWSLARKIEELLELHNKVQESLKVVDERLKALEHHLLRLESEKAQIITEARSAATAASTIISGGIVSDAVTRITRLEGRADQLEQRRLSAPPSQ